MPGPSYKKKAVLPKTGIRKNWRDSCQFECAAYELAKLVREGVMERDDALARLTEPQNGELVAVVRERLGL